MLLTCPECSAKYNVADGAIPAKGRTVRCVACQHSWMQTPIAVAGANFSLSNDEKKIIENSGLRVRAKASTAVPIEPHAKMRKKVHDKIVLGNRLAAGVPWGVAAVVLIGCGLTAIQYRTDIVRAWPKSSSAFAAIGQPANLYGIDIRAVQARAGLDVKGPRVTISGTLASVSRKDEAVAYLKVSLVDAKGVEKLSWMVNPRIEVLPAGKSHVFETTHANPLSGELKAVVVFAEPPPKAPRPAPEPPTGKTGLMGAKPQAAPKLAESDPPQTADKPAPVTLTAR
jgi:predicted Zn finger-like uncharacterized protein